jgi:hypothetical protein
MFYYWIPNAPAALHGTTAVSAAISLFHLSYFAGAVEVEVFYRLIPLTLNLLLGNWYRIGAHHNSFFGVGAVATALRESPGAIAG